MAFEISTAWVRNSIASGTVLLPVSTERLKEFYDSVLCLGLPDPIETNNGTPIAGAAGVGLSAIFPDIPQRFPAIDLLRYLRDDCNKGRVNMVPSCRPSVTLGDIEQTLIRFGQTHDLLTHASI